MILANKVKLSTSGGGQVLVQIEEFVVNFILPVVLMAIVIGICVMYILPTRKEIPDLQTQVATKTQEVSVLQAKVDQLTTLEANKALVLSDLVKLSWALEERDKVPELTQQVKLMSDDSKVTFASLDYTNANKGDVAAVAPSPSAIPDPELYREEKVNVSIDAKDMTAVVDFLKTTENSIRLFKMESLRISSTEVSTGTTEEKEKANSVDTIMASPYLNPAFSAYSETSAPINLTDPAYRSFMEKLDTFKNYAKDIDATLPKI